MIDIVGECCAVALLIAGTIVAIGFGILELVDLIKCWKDYT